MNPFSEIELQMLNGFALFIAGIIAFGGVIVLACITYLETRDWWQAAHEPDPAPPVTGTQPTPAPTARVSHLVIVPPRPNQPYRIVTDEELGWLADVTDPKREGLRCPQGHHVIHEKGGGR